jgi:hypothetical protein
MDMNEKGGVFIEKTIKRLGRPLEVYDMKDYIRNATDRSLSLPRVMKKSIMERIRSGNKADWIWSSGIILLGKDKELKELLKEKFLEKRSI